MKKMLLTLLISVFSMTAMWDNTSALKAIKAAANNPTQEKIVAEKLVAWEKALNGRPLPNVVLNTWKQIFPKDDFHVIGGGGTPTECPAVQDALSIFNSANGSKNDATLNGAIAKINGLNKAGCSTADNAKIDGYVQQLTAQISGGRKPAEEIKDLYDKAVTLLREILPAGSSSTDTDIQRETQDFKAAVKPLVQ